MVVRAVLVKWLFYLIVARAQLNGIISESLGRVGVAAFILGRVVVVAGIFGVGVMVRTGNHFPNRQELLDLLVVTGMIDLVSALFLPHSA